MFRNSVQSLQVNSGAVVSEIADIRGLDIVALFAPALTSCQAFIQVSPTVPAPGTVPTSASFVRMFKADGTSTWVWSAADGDVAVSPIPDVSSFPAARIETSVAQGDNRVFRLLGKG